MKYEIDLHEKHFSKKLTDMMQYMGLVDKKGNPCPIALYNKLYPEDFINEDMIKEDRQRITDKTRKCRNWINGKNFPKDIKDVLLLCKKLECDLDYFFTNMPCPTHDIQFIQNETGLSTEVIERLNSENGNSRLKQLNELMINETFWEILNYFCNYSTTYSSIVERNKYNSELFWEYAKLQKNPNTQEQFRNVSMELDKIRRNYELTRNRCSILFDEKIRDVFLPKE